MASQPNWIAGRYEILAEIGRGGMGLVVRAYDHRLDTEVAIKLLRKDLAKDSGDKDSLIKEARVLARLTHPSIVRLFDLAETEIGLMLILEFVRGPNFAQVLDIRGRLTIDEFLHVARQVCAGLAAAHAEGVIHRDLKPPNLLVAPGLPQATGPEFLLHSRIKITDFGISKLLATKVHAAAGASPATDATTSAAGTPVFMAPEQFAGRPCTPATDVYALGVIAYLALSGRPPFLSDNVRELAFQHFQATAEPIKDCAPQVNAVIQHALAKAPGERFQSAMDFLAALESACAPTPPPPPLFVEPPILEPDGLDRAAAWLGRNWWKLAVGFLVLLMAFALLVKQVPAPQPKPFGPLSEGPRPSLGKLIDLPADLDVVPVAQTLPVPIVGPTVAPRPGPRKVPHAIWTGLLDSDDFHSSAAVDGVSPDGIVYIRDEGSKSLWAVNDSGLKWGFRAPEPANLARFGVHAPSWPESSHVDFRDLGRVWLASCPDSKAGCDAVVFNAAGKGGKYDQLPSALRVRVGERSQISSDFREDDAQNGHWPDDHPQLRYSSRLGTVALYGAGEGWTAPLDSRASKAVQASGRWIVATAHDTIYSIDSLGRVEWTYSSPSPIQSIEVHVSGGVLLLSGKGHESIQSIRSGAKQWEFNSPGWIREIGPIDGTGAMYLAATSGNNLAFYGIDTAGKTMWSMFWGGRTTSTESLRLDDAGRLYLSNAIFEVGSKARKGVVCLAE